MSNLKKNNEDFIEYLGSISDNLDNYDLKDAVKNDIEYERIELERMKLELEAEQKHTEQRHNLICKIGDMGIKLLMAGLVGVSLYIGNKADVKEYSRTSTIGKKGEKMADDLFRNLR